MCSASRRRAATIAAAAAVAAATGTIVLAGAERLPLEALYVDGVFWFLLVSFALLATTAVASLRAASRAELARLGVVAAAACVVTAISFAVVVPRYRVLADETNLVSTSLSLSVDRSLYNITAVLHTADGQLQILKQGVATRPALFPFLLAILHLSFGYHAWFAFAVNFIVEAATLTLVVFVGRELAGFGYGVLAALLLAAFPLYALVAASAGFDATQLFGLVALLLCAIRFARRPTGLAIERMLILTAIASQCRYESPLLLLPLGVLAASRARALRREGRFSLRLVVAPLLFLPPLLHATVIGASGSQHGQRELRDKAIFSLGYVARNLRHALELFFDVHARNFPVARPTALLAVVGAVLVVAGLRRRAFRQAHLPVVAYALVAVGLFAAVHLSFALGDLTSPYNARLATVYLGPLALVAAVPLHRLWRLLPARARAPLVAATAVALLCVYLPVARRNQLMGALILSHEYEQNLERLRAWPPEHLVVVANRPGMYVAQDVAAIYPGDLVGRWPDLHDRARAQGERIVVIQHVDVRTRAVDPALPSTLVLRTVDQYVLDGRVEVRISEVALEPIVAAQADRGPAGHSSSMAR